MAEPILTSDAVQRIVTEVLRRIRSEATLPPSPAAQPPTAAAPAPAARLPEPGPEIPATLALADKVITLATLERLPAGLVRVTIGPTAVVTPSAREFARDAGIDVVRGRATAATVPLPRPFFVAQAESDLAAAARAAAIVRAVPGTQQLAAAGLEDVAATLANHLARDGGRAMLLATRPVLATTVANRSPGVRAVTGRDAAAVLAAAAECAANLVVVDPRQCAAGSLERLGIEFARRDLGPVPRELAAPLQPATPCSCKGHAHP